MATFMMFAMGVVLYGTTVLLPILLQTLMGYTAQVSGLVLSPGGIVTLFMMPLVGRLLGDFPTSLAGGLRTPHSGRGYVPAVPVEPPNRLLDLRIVWIVSRGGMPFLFVPINVMAFAFVPKKDEQRDGTD